MLEGINYLHAKFQINILKNKKVIKLLQLWTLWLKKKKKKKKKENSKYKRVVITTLKKQLRGIYGIKIFPFLWILEPKGRFVLDFWNSLVEFAIF